MNSLTPKKQVYFDLSDADLIDNTVMESIHLYMEDYNQDGGNCIITGLEVHKPFSNHHLAGRRKESQHSNI